MHQGQSVAVANSAISTPTNDKAAALLQSTDQAKLTLVLLVVLMILGLLLSSRSGGGWIGKASLGKKHDIG